ncbi:hypothetical protein [Streptomyces resistomycificus]|nr:hypothetical protein [Streptomyces resistomycificus]
MRRSGVRRRDRRRELAVWTGMSVTALALLMAGASPASAGGPTSVLLVSPRSTETASLYHSDRQYEELTQLLGAPDKGVVDRPPEADLAESRQINVTWMVHDVTPWRRDRVFMADEGREAWIHTAANEPALPAGVWHRAGHPDRLHGLLEELGLMGRASPDGSSGIAYPAPWQAEEDAAAGTAAGATGSAGTAGQTGPETAASPSAMSGAKDRIGWWWALPGAAAGAGLALILRPFTSRRPPHRSRRVEEPRQELLDG